MIGVILNPHAGAVLRQGVRQLLDEIKTAIPDAEIHVLTPDDSIVAVGQALLARGATCLAAAGGDGTVRGVAALLVGTRTPLGVLPVGTFNHFARDVGVGRAVPVALKILAQQYVLPVDAGMVNGQIFVNNSSIGIYARMVRIRERYEQRIGKWRALVWAAWLVIRRAESLSLEVVGDELNTKLHSYLLFVGNNQYQLRLLHLGQRARIDRGNLGCFTLDRPNRLRLLPSVFHMLRDANQNRRILHAFTAQEMTVHALGNHEQRIEVACDGEVLTLALPLRYRSLPGSLRVVVPELSRSGHSTVHDSVIQDTVRPHL